MEKKYPYFKCLIPITSNKDIDDLARIISVKLFGGIPFGGMEEQIYEEVPAVFIENPILGFQVVIQGFGGEKGYTLEVRSHPEIIEPDDADEIEVDITGYVSTLLEGTDGLQIRYEELQNMKHYIEITE
ncbi:hypothetical protein MOB49_03180 [Bacillus haynesii]|uniref:hypothetical protein n=1 Tax=Bacillus haynesii TaxID=1925021 RepID=UPI0015F3545E|nr:hypothetical protein [Bacillus haynesii]UIN47866.1 hypothetical protein LXN06_09350 [Bacillus licheniformis]MCY7836120.1 hypothetical protein [Bacillus haynesii]MCY7966074.1 hypothetical protein [Bacillus haynesii]MCY8141847.1 hypothetical protein [Bacillus haynesii]MCY8216847.1 hypothetical protein [Bacillus haynesii]